MPHEEACHKIMHKTSCCVSIKQKMQEALERNFFLIDEWIYHVWYAKVKIWLWIQASMKHNWSAAIDLCLLKVNNAVR